MSDEKPDTIQQEFADYLARTNPPGERPQPGSARWRDLRSAFMAGARFSAEAMSDAIADHD